MPCIFCGAPKTTNEHVFAEWVSEVFPGKGQRVTHAFDPFLNPGEPRKWTTVGYSLKANAVCQPVCNGGWMSRLETRAKRFLAPMMLGNRLTLRTEGRKEVAHWALKTGMMVDQLWAPNERTIPAKNYPELYAADGVLPNTFVWLGASQFGLEGVCATAKLLIDVGDADLTPAWSAILGVGHLVLWVLRVESVDQKTLQIGGQHGPALHRIWPEEGGVGWPPGALIDPRALRWLNALLPMMGLE